jgi:hypothetical protein
MPDDQQIQYLRVSMSFNVEDLQILLPLTPNGLLHEDTLINAGYLNVSCLKYRDPATGDVHCIFKNQVDKTFAPVVGMYDEVHVLVMDASSLPHSNGNINVGHEYILKRLDTLTTAIYKQGSDLRTEMGLMTNSFNMQLKDLNSSVNTLQTSTADLVTKKDLQTAGLVKKTEMDTAINNLKVELKEEIKEARSIKLQVGIAVLTVLALILTNFGTIVALYFTFRK